MIDQAARAQQPVRPRPAPRGRKEPAPDAPALFAATEIAPASLGTRVVASLRMAAQRQLLRRPPSDQGLTALIDALAAAGGRLTLTEAASAAGESPVRMSGYLAQATRLLNVDGYAVPQQTDSAVQLS